ncbi:TAP-like protein [Haloactinopolyspora alba]|uniref:TAP-like protein n=1 Tax=Haloactinopolyspora alba TaxID=648780 RepID=A0A2P8DY29_9ACTN|nr:alpha/beta hydrolase [Haloactinopolyspora alba]PSL02130.1 TAP-like protein [Haloactinopolyspora alba]
MPVHRAALVAAVTAGTILATTTAYAASDGPRDDAAPERARTPDQVEAPLPELTWEPCDDDLQCTKAQVPLDYDDPSGRTTELALARRPADEPDARIGTLFVNPGGPGEPALEYMSWYAENLPPAVLERFDVVGIDPRGIGASAPLQCRPGDGDGDVPEPPSVQFPVTKREAHEKLRYDRRVRRACATGANPIIDHMTTADTARDMDLVRQAVGDEQLTYYGISYGSYLGATYAAMFPERIRAMVVDGVMDPIGYATGHDDADADLPVTARWGSAAGAWKTLTRAFAECDRVGPERCATAGESTATWMRIVERLKQGPVRLDGERLTYQDVVTHADAALRDVTALRPFMSFLDATDDALSGTADEEARSDAAAAYTRLRQHLSSSEPAATSSDGALTPRTEAVICADSANPESPRSWIDAGARADRAAPWFGRFWTWRSSSCAQWPGSSADAYRGPFETDTSAPVLLVATLHDPATPISGARTLNTLLDGSRMLTVDGWGHGALGESACLASHARDYLVSGVLPPAGTVCEQDDKPFPLTEGERSSR